MRISDWSSDVCSSDLKKRVTSAIGTFSTEYEIDSESVFKSVTSYSRIRFRSLSDANRTAIPGQLSRMDDLTRTFQQEVRFNFRRNWRSEEHKSELQSLMRISYAVFCLKNKKKKRQLKID